MGSRSTCNKHVVLMPLLYGAMHQLKTRLTRLRGPAERRERITHPITGPERCSRIEDLKNDGLLARFLGLPRRQTRWGGADRTVMFVTSVSWVCQQWQARLRLPRVQVPRVGKPIMGMAAMLFDSPTSSRGFMRAGFVMSETFKQVHTLVHGSQQNQERQCKCRHAASHALSISPDCSR